MARRLVGFIHACHPGPTAAVTVVFTAFGWSLGWQGFALALLAVTVLVGQLSVGWSNDAFDAGLDAQSARTSKPTFQGRLTARSLWIAAATALVISSVLSWAIAGPIGGSFHVFALLVAWTYNVALSRTVWSWLPYALAFGSVPPFLAYGLDGRPPALWSVACFAIIGVSAHIANALPDIATDTSAGRGGLVIRIGQRRSVIACWVLLGCGTAILIAVAAGSRPWLVPALVLAFAGAVIRGSRSTRPAGMFHAILGVVVVDVAVVVLCA